MAKRGEQESPKGGVDVKADGLGVELGRIAKLFALYVLKDVADESKKIVRLSAAGFSAQEIAALLDKTVANVHTQLSQARRKRGE